MTPDWLTAPCPVPDAAIETQARAREAQVTKPPGSLGALEELAVRIAALQGVTEPLIERIWISVFAADHGVAAEGISAFPQEVTGEMLENFAVGGAAISVLSREIGATLDVVDLGTVNDPGELPCVRRAIIAPATANFTTAPAMDEAQLEAALGAGADSIADARNGGTQLFIGGEMGIGNTTAASALGCALLRVRADVLCGAGTGLDAAGVARKTQVVARALARHTDATAPLEQLRRLGGFEIAALVGAYVAAAQARMPILVDGFITTVAALAAVRINPGCRPWLLFAHRSAERGHTRVLEALDAKPLLDLGLRLGEASGAALAVPLLRLACTLHNQMATFEEAGIAAS